MQKIRSISYRFRLFTSLTALALLLSALVVTPVRAEKICDNLCWGWTSTSGCTNCQYCCYDSGTTTCKRINNSDCGTGGPSDLEFN